MNKNAKIENKHGVLIDYVMHFHKVTKSPVNYLKNRLLLAQTY